MADAGGDYLFVDADLSLELEPAERKAVVLHLTGARESDIWSRSRHETWGVVLPNTPSYQWYVLGNQPGSPIDNGEFALWNSAAKGYLIASHQTWGVSLDWYKPSGGSTSTVHTASVTMTAQPPVQGMCHSSATRALGTGFDPRCAPVGLGQVRRERLA